jgi:RHS repeat-associated protein
VYDELGRQTQTWQGPVGSGVKRAEWLYDTILYGQPTSSTRFDGANAYSTAVTGYDAGYRPTGMSVTIPGVEAGLAGTYTFGTTYTANGQVATGSLPATGGLPAETLTATYHPNGAPRKLTGSGQTGTNNYVTQTTYLPTGQLTSMTHNTSTAYRGYSYDPVTMRVSSYNVQSAGTPAWLANTWYSYDDAGNITKISDLLEQGGYGADDTQCFGYDHLRRLTQAWTPDSNDCTSAPSVPGLGGPAPYWLSWTFDPVGNRTSQTNHTAGGDQTTNYSYPQPGQPRPHALQSTSGAQAGSYGYDNAGNTTTRPGPFGGQQTLTWDPEGHLATLTEGSQTSSYLYDASGNRLFTRDSTGTTLHLPMGVELHAATGGGVVTCTRVYSHAGQTVATRTTTGGLTWLFTDHQNTASIALRHADMSVTRRYQTPYGTARGGTPSWPNRHGYVDGFVDTTGLTHLGAREYDPGTGRFISVDPIMNLADPQMWQGYSYANNSPVTLSDPGGTDPGGGQRIDDQNGWGLNKGCGIAAGYVAHYSGGAATCTSSSNFPGTRTKPKSLTSAVIAVKKAISQQDPCMLSGNNVCQLPCSVGSDPACQIQLNTGGQLVPGNTRTWGAGVDCSIIPVSVFQLCGATISAAGSGEGQATSGGKPKAAPPEVPRLVDEKGNPLKPRDEVERELIEEAKKLLQDKESGALQLSEEALERIRQNPSLKNSEWGKVLDPAYKERLMANVVLKGRIRVNGNVGVDIERIDKAPRPADWYDLTTGGAAWREHTQRGYPGVGVGIIWSG